MAEWRLSDIQISIVDDASGGSVVTIRIKTPAGELLAMGVIEAFGPELVLAAVHIQSESLRPNMLGWSKLRLVARALAEKADVDVVVIKGAVRTTGAGVGRLPGAIRFARTLRPAC